MSGNQKGQTLIELIVVIAVSVIVVGALVFATIASLRNAQFAKNQVQATKLAQEGIERVRIGRDRNKAITILGTTNVNSWNGNSSGVGAIWDYQIANGCASGISGTACYFKLSPTGESLTYITSSPTFPDLGTEEFGQFKRAIILNDDSSWRVQKTVTAIVRWVDFSGDHMSRLTTILRKIQ